VVGDAIDFLKMDSLISLIFCYHSHDLKLWAHELLEHESKWELPCVFCHAMFIKTIFRVWHKRK